MSNERLAENARQQREAIVGKVRSAMDQVREQVELHTADGRQLPWRLSVATVLSIAGVDKKTLRQPYHRALRNDVERFLQATRKLAFSSTTKSATRTAHGRRALARVEVDKAQLIYALELRLRKLDEDLKEARARIARFEEQLDKPFVQSQETDADSTDGCVLQFPVTRDLPPR